MTVVADDVCWGTVNHQRAVAGVFDIRVYHLETGNGNIVVVLVLMSLCCWEAAAMAESSIGLSLRVKELWVMQEEEPVEPLVIAGL